MDVGSEIKKFVESVIPDRKEYKDKLGMGYSSMYKYFTNEREPGYKVLKRLVDLGFDVNKIFPKTNKFEHKKSA